MKKIFSVFMCILILYGNVCIYASEEKSLTFDAHDEVIWPCIDEVKNYLLAGGYADINEFDYHVSLQAQPVTFSWTAENLSATGYTLEIATKDDFSDAESISLESEATSYSFKYLLRDTKYYLRLTAMGEENITAQTEFSTAYGCPRFLDVGGRFNNVRDLGGYKVGEKAVLQNMIIRGSSPDNCADAESVTLTDEGFEFLTQNVGIKTQLDLRGGTENCGRTTSTFPGASYVHVPLTQYNECFSSSQAELYRQAFSVFANPDNYPVYLHCAGGADRTGTVAAILLAYLGVSEEEIIQDYVVTSFSPVCSGSTARSKGNVIQVLNGFDDYAGNSLSEKVKSYFTSIGLTQREIYNIKAIMFGESLDDYVYTKDYGICLAETRYNTDSGEDFVITLNENNPVSDILIDGDSVDFEQNICTITIPASVLVNLSDGTHEGKVVFSDGVETKFSLGINFYDLTGELQVASTLSEGDYTYVSIVASSHVFGSINYHFHTKRDTLYPDIEPHILINGKSVAYLNDNVDMSSYTWNDSPASTDGRFRVPVSVLAQTNTLKLLCRAEWLEGYLDGKDMTITLEEGLSYTYEGITYSVLSDIKYVYKDGSWMKVIADTTSGSCGDNLTWEIDDEGTLTISGTGAMADWSIDNGAPWYGKASAITNVVISENVTTIGDYAFYGCDNITSIYYEGTEEGWEAIEKGSGNACLETAEITFGKSSIYDLTGELQVATTTSGGDYTYVSIVANENIFEGINYHFHTKRDSTYPDIQPHILINGVSVDYLNDNTDMSSYTWNTTPANTDSRHRFPVSILAQGNTMKLLCRADWLEEYLDGEDMVVTLEEGFSYTYDGITYSLLSDIKYIYTDGSWIKFDEVTSGSCGENLTWEIEEGTLTISGSGAMTDWTEEEKAPWSSKASSITSVSIAENVTAIGDYAFYGCDNITSIDYEGTVEGWEAIEKGSGNACLETAEITFGKTVSYNITVTGSTGGSVLSDGEAVSGMFSATQGGRVTLTAVPDENAEFKAWLNAKTKKVLSTEETYTFDVYANRSILALFADNSSEGEVFISFISRNDQYVYYSYVNSGIDTGTCAPSGEKMYAVGYTFKGFNPETGEVASNTDYKGVYEKEAGTYEITVIRGCDKKGRASFTAEYNTLCEVVANAPEEGEVFVGWKLNGKTVSYDETYSFFAFDDITVEACYAENGVKAPIVALLTATTAMKDEIKIASVLGTSYIPDDCAFVEAGIIYVKTDADESSLVLENEGTKVNEREIKRTMVTDKNRMFRLTASYKEEGITVRGYMVYLDENGTRRVIYTDSVLVPGENEGSGGIEEDVDFN